MPWFPRRIFHDWPQGAQELPTEEVIKLYENGFAGCSYSPEEKEKFAESQAWPDGEMAAHEFGIADTGAESEVSKAEIPPMDHPSVP